MNARIAWDRLVRLGLRLGTQLRRPLGLAMLAAVLVHALVLSHAEIRRSRTSARQPLPSAPDDTPELLRFSRRAAVEVPLSTIPIPPLTLLPPPPAPALPPPAAGISPAPRPSARSGRPPASASKPAPKPTAKPNQKSNRQRQQPSTGARRAASAAPSTGRGAAVALPGQLAEARRTLESLVASPPKDGKDGADGAPLLALWQQAGLVDGAALPPGLQLRRLPAAAVRDLGLSEGERRSARSSERLLVVWVEGSQAWLLGQDAAPEREAGAG